ncbi:hypothetical protein VZ191_05530 [Enterobacter roggenkampii]|uniref:hypothetical protein n=1 Tax=Enterobacter roggenkampii TaxID=1812935 RepID=UPI002E298159|nr:hypothetical protein [Enterobacter roggenkampii]MED5757828.1 hypothetical protein [Enterobacter roggenkampii]
MAERGMIFNAEMVRAILDGRKTQTRRIMKVQPVLNGNFYEVFGAGWSKGIKSVPAVPGHSLSTKCPFGTVGDRIWVREAFRVMGCATDVARLMYKASERNSFTESTRTVPVASCTKQPSQKWTPSIHMPRWASRITLEITDVRVERLNSIIEDDAAAEGVGSAIWFAATGVPEDEWSSLGEHGAERASHINTFATLWESIYGAESWQANPWVWVIEFRRVEGGEA